MPPAAAVPVRNAVGSDQKQDVTERHPAVVMVKPIMDMSGCDLPAKPVMIRPVAAIRAGIATCQRRSMVLSEWRPLSDMATAANIQGIELMRPLLNSPFTPISFTNCGRKKVTP